MTYSCLSDIEQARWILVTIDPIVGAFRVRGRRLLRQAIIFAPLRRIGFVGLSLPIRASSVVQLVGIGGHGWLMMWLAPCRLRYDKVFFVRCSHFLAAPADHDAGDNAHKDDPNGHAASDDETFAMGREILSGESVPKSETTKYQGHETAPPIVTKGVSSVLH